jgi:hypothetical protein
MDIVGEYETKSLIIKYLPTALVSRLSTYLQKKFHIFT